MNVIVILHIYTLKHCAKKETLCAIIFIIWTSNNNLFGHWN